jgi:ubiquinone/menaquinone biosynthesis C-methylase UbiE
MTTTATTAMAPKEQATYSHGHHSSVVNSHARRTAKDSAAYLLPHIQPHFTILDIGCGPGTITTDLAQLVPQGRVIGVDAVEEVLSQARSHAEGRGVTANLEFRSVDANALPFEDGTFDIVHCHQVLQHVKDPVGILREMRRVAKPGSGIVAAREADYKSFTWYPEPRELDDWMALYQKIGPANGAEPNAGRFLRKWCKEAGYEGERITLSWDSWLYTGEAAQHWGKSWAGRVLSSNYASSVLGHGFGTQEELKKISEAWKAWGEDPDAFIAVPNGEILYRKGA